MNPQRSRKPAGDGVLDLLTLGVEPGESGCQSLEAFCESRKLSLRSRLELVEHVCSLVCAAHDSGSGFLRISCKSVNVEYVGGGLSIDIPGSLAIPGARAAGETRMGTGRFSAGQLIRAANVVELGQMLADLVGRVAKLDPPCAPSSSAPPACSPTAAWNRCTRCATKSPSSAARARPAATARPRSRWSTSRASRSAGPGPTDSGGVARLHQQRAKVGQAAPHQLAARIQGQSAQVRELLHRVAEQVQPHRALPPWR